MTRSADFADLPADAQIRITAACERFKAALRSGQRQDVAEIVGAAVPADRPVLEAALARVLAENAPLPSDLIRIRLAVTAGPHAGKCFTFDGHDSFLVGRTKDAHLQLNYDDPYFSRRHFLIEVNPPRCRLLDLNSRNGTRVNGIRVQTAELNDGDEVSAGHTTFKVAMITPGPNTQGTIDLPTGDTTVPPLELPLAAALPGSGSIPDVPGFRLETEIGRGAMGVVYRGVRSADNYPVAVKVIVPAPGTSRRQVERFLREARILGELQHRNVVGFLDAGEAGPALYLAMELVNGPDASRVLKERGPMELRTAVRLICQLLSALEYAHGHGIVHRDIKPANVLLGVTAGKRVVKLADFGLARLYETSKLSGLTMQGEIGGTPAFMAPEQVTHYRDVTPAADQYSAAATLYTLLSGKNVFDCPPEAALALIQIISEKPVPIRERRSDLPEGLASVIHKALSREPQERFADVEAFAAALRPFAG